MSDALILPAPAAREHIQALARVPLAGLVKLRDSDWLRVPEGPVFFHLNAEPCTNQVGGVYAIARIASTGSASAPATMDAGQWTLVRCTALQTLASVWDVPLNALPNLVGTPKDHARLLELMLGRYRGLRAEWEAAPGGAVVLCTFERLT